MNTNSQNTPPTLARRLGVFDATMIVMGGIIGSGIFMNPHVVAEFVHTPFMILLAWLIGGGMAIVGAFVYAELAARRPEAGGEYVYLKEAYHPALGFVYGWALLFVIQSGGMAAVALTFARYFLAFTGIGTPDWLVASITLAALTGINCVGVKEGSNVQSVLMILKIAAIVMLVSCGFFLIHGSKFTMQPLLDAPPSFDLLTAMGAALVPVLFAYGGWQTSNFIAGEVENPTKNLPRGLLYGTGGVVLLYIAVNYVCLHALGADGLAQTKTPATAVMELALGPVGGSLIGIGIAISTLGFLSQSILTGPRVYYAMARDGLFFKSIAKVHPKTQVPLNAIVLQGVLAIAIALVGKYEGILNYVVVADWIWFGLGGTCIFLLRKQDLARGNPDISYKIPGHPYTTFAFVVVSWAIVLNTIYKFPTNTLIGIVIILSGIPIYYFWKWKNKLS